MAILDSSLMGRPSRLRLLGLPIASTVAGSCVGLLPFIASMPALPSFGLLMALGWRLLRPELWAAWMALPLGLADDLIGGAPLGTAMTLWTIAFLGIDLVDSRPMWRDHWLDWWVATGAILFCAAGSWGIGLFIAGGGAGWPLVVPTIVALLAFPPIARLCATLDRWRLAR